jgi:hypothetical protein
LYDTYTGWSYSRAKMEARREDSFSSLRDDKEMGEGDKPPPISLADHSPLVIGRWFLCDLAENLGFEGLVRANSHLDLLGLGFRLLGKVNLQHALVVVGAYLTEVHGTG